MMEQVVFDIEVTTYYFSFSFDLTHNIEYGLHVYFSFHSLAAIICPFKYEKWIRKTKKKKETLSSTQSLHSLYRLFYHS
jgi:hypothetical protein